MQDATEILPLNVETSASALQQRNRSSGLVLVIITRLCTMNAAATANNSNSKVSISINIRAFSISHLPIVDSWDATISSSSAPKSTIRVSGHDCYNIEPERAKPTIQQPSA